MSRPILLTEVLNELLHITLKIPLILIFPPNKTILPKKASITNYYLCIYSDANSRIWSIHFLKLTQVIISLSQNKL